MQGIEDMKKFQGQFILGDAWPVADLIVEYIKLQPGVVQAAIAGDIRRGWEIVRQVEIVAACEEPVILANVLSGMPGVVYADTAAKDTISLTLSNGLICRVYAVAVADHSQTAVYAGGLKVETVLAQRKEIEKINAANPDFVILAGIESDILPDGSLDYPDETLASFDFVVASVHSAFRQSEADMTRRIIRAMENRYVSMLGHPTGRLLLGRKGYAVNLAEVIQAAADNGTIIEINANPFRLDLDWRWCRTAKEKGVLMAINPDAHAVAEFEHLRYGLASARKAALTASDIVNSRSYPEILKLLRRKR